MFSDTNSRLRLTGNTYESAGEKREDIHERFQRARLPCLDAIAALDAPLAQAVPGIVEPEGACDPVRVPAGEEAGGDGHEVGEDRDADGEDKGGAVGEHDQDRPGRPAEDGVFVEVARASEQADKEEFGRRVRVEAAGDEEVGQCDAVLFDRVVHVSKESLSGYYIPE